MIVEGKSETWNLEWREYKNIQMTYGEMPVFFFIFFFDNGGVDD